MRTQKENEEWEQQWQNWVTVLNTTEIVVPPSLLSYCQSRICKRGHLIGALTCYWGIYLSKQIRGTCSGKQDVGDKSVMAR